LPETEAERRRGRESGGERERERRSGTRNLQTVSAFTRVAFIARAAAHAATFPGGIAQTRRRGRVFIAPPFFRVRWSFARAKLAVFLPRTPFAASVGDALRSRA
jgi:hypothetical protein